MRATVADNLRLLTFDLICTYKFVMHIGAFIWINVLYKSDTLFTSLFKMKNISHFKCYIIEYKSEGFHIKYLE